jgi:hypothetical protein
MLFVTLCKPRGGNQRERMARRLDWTYPPGVKLVAEYWLQTDDPKVIVVTEAEDFGPMMAATAVWDDVFEMTVVPAVTAEQGLQLVKESMAAIAE